MIAFRSFIHKRRSPNEGPEKKGFAMIGCFPCYRKRINLLWKSLKYLSAIMVHHEEINCSSLKPFIATSIMIVIFIYIHHYLWPHLALIKLKDRDSSNVGYKGCGSLERWA